MRSYFGDTTLAANYSPSPSHIKYYVGIWIWAAFGHKGTVKSGPALSENCGRAHVVSVGVAVFAFVLADFGAPITSGRAE